MPDLERTEQPDSDKQNKEVLDIVLRLLPDALANEFRSFIAAKVASEDTVLRLGLGFIDRRYPGTRDRLAKFIAMEEEIHRLEGERDFWQQRTLELETLLRNQK